MDQAALKALHEFEAFRRVLSDALKNVPQVPSFDPDNPNAVEEWKAVSQRREGFRLAMSYFGVKIDDR